MTSAEVVILTQLRDSRGSVCWGARPVCRPRRPSPSGGSGLAAGGADGRAAGVPTRGSSTRSAPRSRTA